MQYIQDNDEKLPSSTFWGYGWAEKINPYVKSSGVFHCPDDSHVVKVGSPAGAVPISYAISGPIAQAVNLGNGLVDGLTLAQMAAPASTVLIVESSRNGNGDMNEADFVNPDPNHEGYEAKNNSHICWYVFGNDDQVDQNRHDTSGQSLEWLCADGHVKYVPANRVSNALNLSNGGGTGAGGAISVNNLSGTQFSLTMSYN